MADDKVKTISTRITSAEFWNEIEQECKRLRISKTALLREAIKRFLGAAKWMRNLTNEKDKLERKLEASESIRERLDEGIKERNDRYDALLKEKDAIAKDRDALKAELEESNTLRKELKAENRELTAENSSVCKQRDKFKQKFEHAFQTNEVLIEKIRLLQSDGLFKRASGVKRINLAIYTLTNAQEETKEK